MNITPQAHRFVLLSVLFIIALAYVPQTAHAQDGTMKFALIPISADGVHAIMGNRIVLAHGGQRVFIEFRYSGWDPELIQSFQYKLDSSGYSNGVGDPLAPAVEPCLEDTDCVNVFGPGAVCTLSNDGNGPNYLGVNFCRAAFHEKGRSDDIPEENGGPWNVNGVNTGTLDFLFGHAKIVDPTKSDPGFSVYSHTMILDIPIGAAGIYVIDNIPEASRVNGELGDVPFVLEPLIIEIAGGCCFTEGICSSAMVENCLSMGGTPVSACSPKDCNNNGITDVCDIASGSSDDTNGDGWPDECGLGFAFSLIPVNASGQHTISGHNIILPQGGQRVWFEVKYYNWAPELLIAFQSQIDSNGYDNGIGEPLSLPVIPCTTHTDCENVLGPDAKCALPGDPSNITGENTCLGGFRTKDRADDIPKENGGMWGITGVTTSTLDFIFGGATLVDPPKTDPGFDVYTGTLVLDVPLGAAGQYVIDFIPENSNATNDNGKSIPIDSFFSATVEIAGGCCYPEGVCSSAMIENCQFMGGTLVPACVQQDCNNNGITDVCEIAAGDGTDCDSNLQLDSCEISSNRSAMDCNYSFTLDSCDLAEGTSQDCNNNNIPDECDILTDLMNMDCNLNDILDSCELAMNPNLDCNNNNILDECEQSGNASGDCNGNGILDECDLAVGTSQDLDGNCLPDECDPMLGAQAESIFSPKSRYISFIPVNTGCSSAIRVKLVSLMHPETATMTLRPDISAFEGEYRWVGPQEIYPEGINENSYLFTGSALQCDPYFADWKSVGLIHVYGLEVVPSSIYEVQMVDSTCADLNDPSCYTDPLMLQTGAWGDAIKPFALSSMTTQPDINDVMAVVNKFRGKLNPIKASSQQRPGLVNPSKFVSIDDVLVTVNAWLSSTYTYEAPQSCNP